MGEYERMGVCFGRVITSELWDTRQNELQEAEGSNQYERETHASRSRGFAEVFA
jgi:hypothetical protein